MGVTVLLILNDLNPVIVWVKDKSDILHPSIGEALLPVDIQRFKSGASGIQIVHGDACFH